MCQKKHTPSYAAGGCRIMADGEGFEPPGPFQARLFSKQVL